MSERDDDLVFETILDAPPEKIWRALTIPEYRDRWMQRPDDVSVSLEATDAHSLLTYRWTERGEVSRVTIELTPQADGQTGFRLTHAPIRIPAAANSNEPAATALMRAA
ncbi:polyketide cyclase [Devosia sediminis]|uniref:Polyketide cyclase n=1 Tax=Devosia sediminis TaxID=2798801 RepID=A0A934INJ6_9HYPH|nr:polyketide cyclase [Devosia sediminis]MBJ3783968.1 polyketide cyclase [Devosia sediminis]